MTTTRPTAEKRTDRTDPRPTRIHLGIDARGYDHHYVPHREAVVVIRAGTGARKRLQVAETVAGPAATIYDYIDEVRARHDGWLVGPKLVETAAEALATNAE